jgi:dolichol-phosphate mannosyltransferase
MGSFPKRSSPVAFSIDRRLRFVVEKQRDNGQSAPRMFAYIKKILSPRFFKFCTVGASGVAVNLFFFFLFSDVLGIYVHAAVAMSIEISILSNFTVNEAWTFRDKRNDKERRVGRLLKFHAVSLVGGGIQWSVFVIVNAAILYFIAAPFSVQSAADFMNRYITHPKDSGILKYFAQLAGIGAATFFNFFANVHWTWGRKQEALDER